MSGSRSKGGVSVSERIESVDGIDMYRISRVDEMEPFLMTIVSNSDLWMFVSSNGGLTAGRVAAADCLFPYQTDDRLHRAAGRLGPVTVLRVRGHEGTVLWEPFTADSGHTRRSLFKSLLGDAVMFEEEHLDLGLAFRYRWAPSERFGWVRSVALENRSGAAGLTVDIVDGLAGLMPWGIPVSLQQQMSNLADAYRRSEIIQPGIGIYSLEALIVDRPEPAEALRATTVWTNGLHGSRVSVDSPALTRARRGQPFLPSSLRTGRPGSFLLNATVDLEPGQCHRWRFVADVAQSQADIAGLIVLLESDEDVTGLVEEDIRRSSSQLWGIVARADGMQRTATGKIDAHHLANTLFNVMRGGIFLDGYTIEAERFRAFVADRNRSVAGAHADWLSGLPESMPVQDLRARAGETGDPNLVRLAREYLPLAFSRRHGDPSRPWNQFAIRVRDEHGGPVLSYQGNWRDIFQNWEALCRSFPAFLPSVVAKFVNASTADGFNPYRITSEGIDWEVPEPDNPWSGIGYWGDHQIVYLFRLLRALESHTPGWLAAELGRRVYSFADVPYRIAPYDQLVQNPKATVDYDIDAERTISARVATVGSDGKLALDAAGDIAHVSLLEKLLIPTLAKLSNYVPRGGIWMNTQRPEWNDANNALVGYGLSMVTLAHLRRFLALVNDLAGDMSEAHPVSADVVAWADAVATALEAHSHLVDAEAIDGADRARLMHSLGAAYGRYRAGRYAGAPTTMERLAPDALRRLIRVALQHLDDALRTSRRADGLFEAYNLIRFSAGGSEAAVEHLPVMLEGQVAAISSGLLSAGDVANLVQAMYDSELYRADADSFMLYPARPRPSFLDRNLVPAEPVASNPLLQALLSQERNEIIERDIHGQHRFDADLRNVDDLNAALARLTGTPLEPLVLEHGEATRRLFEQVFHHHTFTGRSSTMYGFEGIGSVYWHMVAKLLVAIQEALLESEPDEIEARAELLDLYDRVRNGLGFNKTVAEYGAFPTDPYSHTPAHAGAQQPGMTGQVKEELLTRWAELGLTVAGGAIRFTPTVLNRREFNAAAGELSYLDAANTCRRIDTPPGTAAFTMCQVPVVVHAVETGPRIVVTRKDETTFEVLESALDEVTSRHIFDRTGHITRLDVYLTPGRIADGAFI